MRKILLDTNAYTNLLLGDSAILTELVNADMIYLPVIVLGELFAGFKGGSKEIKNKSALVKFLSKPGVSIIPIGKETAEIFGELKYKLLTAGNPLPINDVWIASCAIETGAVLITDDNHFTKIEGIRIWKRP